MESKLNLIEIARLVEMLKGRAERLNDLWKKKKELTLRVSELEKCLKQTIESESMEPIKESVMIAMTSELNTAIRRKKTIIKDCLISQEQFDAIQAELERELANEFGASNARDKALALVFDIWNEVA